MTQEERSEMLRTAVTAVDDDSATAAILAAARAWHQADEPHDPTGAAEITDAHHVAVTAAVAAGDLPGARTAFQRASLHDPVADHPFPSLPRLVRVLALSAVRPGHRGRTTPVGRLGPRRPTGDGLDVIRDRRGHTRPRPPW
ncbi:hypothetical protein GCM10023191_009190 [Actinoallomurus oryzae]|uniref:Uncharacterized protein n=1 Tax=Actinoallomurus oryzae TaxID=502180 RepID=A0ABP8PCV7_9ACTN